MKEKEKILFKELCKFESDSFDTSLLEFATPQVLGQLFLTVCRVWLTVYLKKTDALIK